MNKVLKKQNIIKMFLIILIIIPTISNASFLDDIFSSGKDFISTNPTTTNTLSGDSNAVYVPLDQTKIKDLSSNIYNALLTIAMVLAAIIISVLGIQFITGSVEQKAKIKETLIPFAVGCVIVFGAFGIWKIAISILSVI